MSGDIPHRSTRRGNEVIVMTQLKDKLISYLNVLAITDLLESSKFLIGDRVSGDILHRPIRREGKQGNFY